MRAFFDWLLGRKKLREVNDTLAKMVSDLQRQVDGLQAQVKHAAKATNSMAGHSRETEVMIQRIRLSFAEERARNRARFGPAYEIIPEDWWFTQGRAAIKGKAVATLEGSPLLLTRAEIIEKLLALENSQPKQLT